MVKQTFQSFTKSLMHYNTIRKGLQGIFGKSSEFE